MAGGLLRRPSPASRIDHATSRTRSCCELPVDILIPAALEGQITARNASRHQGARWSIEAANGPTTADGDTILAERGIYVVPDILANAGGVIVSYFEWVQDLQSFFWEESEVNQRLRAHHGAQPSTRSPLSPDSATCACARRPTSSRCSAS